MNIMCFRSCLVMAFALIILAFFAGTVLGCTSDVRPDYTQQEPDCD